MSIIVKVNRPITKSKSINQNLQTYVADNVCLDYNDNLGGLCIASYNIREILPDEGKASIYKSNLKSVTGFNISLVQNPTHNCQVSSIASFNMLLNKYHSLKETYGLKLSYDELNFYYMVNIAALVYKRGYALKQILIDVNQSYSSIVKECFKDFEIIINKTYNSTNGSEMEMFLINVTNITNNISSDSNGNLTFKDDERYHKVAKEFFNEQYLETKYGKPKSKKSNSKEEVAI